MQQLKERILREGRVLPGNIIKVDGFLNHRVDTALMRDLADEFAKYFDVKNITMVLTAEASGIALATICAELVAHGLPATTPAAVVRRGTSRDQRVVTSDLANLAADVKAAGITPPALTIVGDVVSLQPRLAWFHPEEEA